MQYFSILLMSLAFCFLSAVAYGQATTPDQSIAGSIWETTFQNLDFEYELKGIGISPNQSKIALLLGVREKGKIAGPQNLRLQLLNATGEIQNELDLGAVAQLKDFQASFQHLAGIAISDEGVAFLVPPIEKGKSQLLGVNVSTGNLVINKLVKLGEHSLKIHKILLAKSGSILVAGGADEKGFVAELNKAGEVLWNGNLGGQVDSVLDAQETNNGFVVAGGRVGQQTSGQLRYFEELWVGLLNSKGELLKTHTFPGPSRSINIAATQWGSYGIVFDRVDNRPGSESAQVLVQELRSDLASAWEKAIVPSTPITAPFSLATIEPKAFIMVGVKERGTLSISRLQDNGKEDWSYSSKATEPLYPRFHGVQILSLGKDVLITSGLSIADGRQQRQIVRVFRFAGSP
jgi:hypothetical protein